MRFFRAASASARRIFVVLNKHDIVSADDRRAALAYVREQLATMFDQESPRIYSVSVRDGLQAKLSEDMVRLDESGLPTLENELVDFLLTEKSTEFLLGMCDRTVNLLHNQPAAPEVRQLANKIRTLAKAVAEDRPDKRETRPITSKPAGDEGAPRLRSCEICAHVNEALWNFLSRFQYDLSIDHEEQQRFAEHGGLCSFHAWQYESIASPQGTCTGFPPLLDHLAERLREMALAGLSKVEELVPNTEGCVMCAVRANAEAAAIVVTARRLSRDPRTMKALSAICLPHLAMLTTAIEDRALLHKLIEHEAIILERLSEDMKRYALKRDAVRRYLLTEEETAAAHRALLLLAGHRNVSNAGTVRTAREAGPPSDRTSADGRSDDGPKLVEAEPP